MPVETRYFRSDTETIDTTTYRKLGTSLSGTGASVSQSGTGYALPPSCQIGVRVYILKSDGTKIELTSNVSAIVYLQYPTSKSLRSATWNCPETDLDSTDRVLIEVYLDNGVSGWVKKGSWVTEQLGATKLDSATWIFYYWVEAPYSFNPRIGRYSFGINFYFDGSDDSRIVNFSYTVGGVAHEVEVSDSTLVSDVVSRGISKSFADAGVSSDFLRRGIGVSLRDSSIVSDVISKRVKKNLVDLGKGIDFIAKGLTISLKECSFPDFTIKTATGKFLEFTEVVYVHEYLRKGSERVVTDLGMVSDYLRKATLKVFTDSSIVSDRIIKESVRCFVDSVVSSDFVRREVSKSILDLSRVSDWMGKALAKVLVDSEVTVDWISKAVSRSFIDSSKSYDYVSKASIKSLKDVGKGVDRISKSVGVSRLDTALVSDWISKEMLKAVLDLGKVADWVSTIKAKLIVVKDVVFPDFSIAKDSVLVKRDSSLISDFYSKSVEKVATDSGVISDRVSLAFSKVLVDSGVVSDYFSKAISKVARDLGRGVDWISKDILTSLVESARVYDWVSRDMVYSLIDSISVADYIRREFSKSFRDYVVGEYVITKTATLHRSYADVVKSVDFVSKGVVSVLRDSVVGSDYLAKEVSRVVSDVARVLDWIGRRFAVTVSDLVKGLDYVSKAVGVSVSDLAKAIDWIVVPTVKLIVVKDVVFPDFSIAKGVEKPFREVISVIDLKAVKDIAKRFVDYVIVRDQAIRTRIIEVFDRVIADFEVAKGLSPAIRDLVKSVDVITKLRYTLTGIDVRRVYFHKYLGDIIEDTDEINRVDSSKNLLNMIKNLASKMGVADDPYISADISKLEEIVGTMEYVKDGEYVYARHVNVFVDYMTYAIDVVELLYDKWKSAKGTSLPEVEYWLEMAKGRKDLMRTVKFGDIVLTRDHNLIIDTLKPLECSIRVMDREW